MLSMALVMALCGTALAIVCPESRNVEMDKCGQRLFLIGDRTQSGLPIKLEDMDTHCNQLREAGKCIHNYTSECLEAMPKQVTSLLLKGSNSELAKQCDGEDKRTEFISHTPCYNADWNKMHSCMDTYIDRLQGLGNAKRDDKIPLTCCNYYKFHDCIIDSLKTQGDGVCSAADRDYMSAMLNGFASDVLGLLCGHTPPQSDLCNVLVSPEKTAGLARPLSMMPPFIKAFGNF